MLADPVLIPALHRLHDRHPDLMLDIATESRAVSLDRRETEIALRFARPTGDAASLTRKVADLRYGLYADAPGQRSLRFLRFGADLAVIPVNDWIDANRKPGDTIAPLAVSDGLSMIAAARAGIGVAVLPTPVGDSIDGLARLRRPCDLSREVWTIVPRSIRHQARVAAVLAWIDDVFGAITS